MKLRRLAPIAAVIASFVLSGTSGGTAPVAADGPGTSFSVDLDAGVAGIQTTRTVPLNTLFSIAVWADSTDLPAFLEADVKIHYDDFRLTTPESAIPADWKDASVLNTTGGTSAPWPASWPCSPDPAINAWTGEDGVGTATLNTACFYELSSSTFFTGQIFEYVLRCDSEGSAAFTIDPDPSWTFLLDESFQVHNDHQHNASVTCGGGTGDADSDGLPDDYENAHACLNAGVADASADPDADAMTSLSEFGLGTDPCDNDSDNDGCADGEEDPSVSMNPVLGGDRDPLSGWDFFDVPAPLSQTPGTDGKPYLVASSVRNKVVSLLDVGVVLAYVGRVSGGSAYYTADNNADGVQDGAQMDRASSVVFGKPWRSGPPNQAVSLLDVGIALLQVGHTCSAAP